MIEIQNRSHKSLPKTQQIKERISLEKTKGYSFYNKRIVSSSKFFSIDSRQMMTQPSKFINSHSNKSLIRNKSKSSSHSLLKQAKQTKNESFLNKKSQNNANDFMVTKKTHKSNHRERTDSKQQVLKIMQRLRNHNKLKIGESTKYKLKDNFSERMLLQKKQNIISTSRIDLNQVINSRNNQFNLNLNLSRFAQQQKQINEKQKGLKSLQNILRSKQVQLQSKQQSLKQKQKFIQTIIKEQAENQKKKQLQIIHKQKEIRQKEKNIKSEQEKLFKFQKQKLAKLQQQKLYQLQQQKRQILQDFKNKQQLQFKNKILQNQISFRRSQQQKSVDSRQIKNQNKDLTAKVYNKNIVDRFQEIQSSTAINLDDIEQINIGSQKSTNRQSNSQQQKQKIFKDKQITKRQTLNQTPTFHNLNTTQKQNGQNQKERLKEQFQKLFYEVQMVTSIGQVPYYCSTCLKKSKYSWQLSCLLLYKYSYDKFLQLQDLLRILVNAKLQKKQVLDSKIQENIAIKGNLIKIKKSVQKKTTLSPKIANFLNLQKKLSKQQRQQFVNCIYKQVEWMCNQYFEDRKPDSFDIESCYLRIVNSILIIEQIQFKQTYPQSVIQQISQENPKQLFNKLNTYSKRVKQIIRKRCV